jgi:hypothetical protein
MAFKAFYHPAAVFGRIRTEFVSFGLTAHPDVFAGFLSLLAGRRAFRRKLCLMLLHAGAELAVARLHARAKFVPVGFASLARTFLRKGGR